MEVLDILNSNKLFGGTAMILMNLGGRHIVRDVPDFFDDIFEHPIARRFIVFCIAFIATRDIKISLLITLLFIILFSYLLKETSKMCIIPKKFLKTREVSKDEYLHALNIVKKYQKTHQN
jgi:hypothetical protein